MPEPTPASEPKGLDIAKLKKVLVDKGIIASASEVE